MSFISWGYDGGNGPGTQDQSTLTNCHAYNHSRSATSSTPALSCSAELAAPGVTEAQLESALANPDVTAAGTATVALYGSDPRGCDGAVLHVLLGGRAMDVGGDCSQSNNCGPAASPCVSTPAGLNTLADLLRQIDTQQLAESPCSGVFQ